MTNLLSISGQSRARLQKIPVQRLQLTADSQRYRRRQSNRQAQESEEDRCNMSFVQHEESLSADQQAGNGEEIEKEKEEKGSSVKVGKEIGFVQGIVALNSLENYFENKDSHDDNDEFGESPSEGEEYSGDDGEYSEDSCGEEESSPSTSEEDTDSPDSSEDSEDSSAENQEPKVEAESPSKEAEKRRAITESIKELMKSCEEPAEPYMEMNEVDTYFEGNLFKSF